MLLALCVMLVTAPSANADNAPVKPGAALQGDEQDIVVTGKRAGNADEASYDVTASSTATKLPLSQRETPQSLSVITRAQLDDFALRDINAALATATGVNVEQVETDRTYYSSRGFDIVNFQIDGIGLPFAYGVQNGAIDLAPYESVEVLRGANGLLSSTGNPSATVDFVHKMPGKTLEASASAQYGSYDDFRLDGDLSLPLTASGSVRARLVGAYLDSKSYLDFYHVKRPVLYGVVQADITATTTITAVYQYQDDRTHGSMWGALPLYYADGAPTDYPRAATTSTPWSHWNFKDQQIFGNVTQQLAGDWTLKISAYRHAVDEDDALFYVYGTPDRDTGKGLYSYPGAFRGPTRELTLDAYISGSVPLLGRRHEIVLGVNRGTARVKEYSSYPSDLDQPLPGNSAFDGSYPYPDFPGFDLSAAFHTRRESVYGLVRLHLGDAWKVMLGGNVTHATSSGYSYGVASAYDRTRALPFAGATYDLSRHLTVYASYAEIFNPQSQIGTDEHILPPIEGDNVEAGLKGSWLDGKLYASAALFRARQNNTAEAGAFVDGQQLYTTIDAACEGIEFDLGGTIVPGLQASGGYTLLRIRNPQGEDARTYVPRNTARLNLSWRPAPLPAVTLGAAVRYQSRIYRDQDATTPGGSEIFTWQGGYAIVDMMARYDLGQHVSLTVNLKNLTNHKYITSLYWDQAYYGAPREALFTLGLKL